MLRCMQKGQMPFFQESLATILEGTGRRKTRVGFSIDPLHQLQNMKGNPAQDRDLNRWKLVLCGANLSVEKKCSVFAHKTLVFIAGNPMLVIWLGIAR